MRRPYRSPLSSLRHPAPYMDGAEEEEDGLSLDRIGGGAPQYVPQSGGDGLDWNFAPPEEYEPTQRERRSRLDLDKILGPDDTGGYKPMEWPVSPAESGLRGLRRPTVPDGAGGGRGAASGATAPTSAPSPHPDDAEFEPAGQGVPNPKLPTWQDGYGQPQGITGTGQAESAGRSFVRGVERNVGSAVGGTIGAIAGTAVAGLALAAVVSNPVGWVAGLVGLAGGTLGWFGGEKLGRMTQDALLGEEETRRLNEQYAIDQAEHPVATFAGSVAPHLAGGFVESSVAKGIGTLRSANAASRSRLLPARAKPNATALEAMEKFGAAETEIQLKRAAVRSAKTPLAKQTAQAQLKAAKETMKGLVRTARENGAVAMSPAGQRVFRGLVNATYLNLEAGATLGWPGDSPYNYNAPEYITPAQELGLDIQNLGERLLSDEEIAKAAETQGDFWKTLGREATEGGSQLWTGDKLFWNSVAQNLTQGAGAITYLPVFGSLHNARYQHDLERRRLKLSGNKVLEYGPDYQNNPEYLADVRRVTADTNLRAIEAKRKQTARGLAADVFMQSVPFMVEIGVAPNFVSVGPESRMAVRAAGSLANMLAKAPFNVAGTLNKAEQLKANTWSITPGEWDALDLAIKQRGDDELTALWKAWADNGIEYLSEGMGDVAQTGLYRILVKKQAPGRVLKFLREMVDEAPPAGSVRSLLKAGGSQPLFEGMEERAGDIMRILAGIDDHAGDIHEDGTPVGKGERLVQAFNPFDPENRLQWGAEFIAFSIPGTMQAAGGLRSLRRERASGAATLAEVRQRTAEHFSRLGMAEEARMALSAESAEDIRENYGEAVTATFEKALRDRAAAELDPDMLGKLTETLKTAPNTASARVEILARFLSSETEMERALAASSALLAGAGEYGEATEQEKEALAQRAVNVLSGMVEEWGNVGGDSAMDRLDAIVADANLRIRNGTLDPSAATWKKADLENLQRAINDRAVHAATSITVRALVDSLSEEDRAQFDRIAFSNQKMEFLDRVLRSKYASLNANFAVAHYVLDNGHLDTLPENMVEALLGAMGRDFAGFGYAVDEKASPREKLRQLTEAVREDERNKEFLDLFAKTGGAEAQRIDVAAEGAEADVPAAFEDLGAPAAPAAPEAPAAAPEDDLDMSPPPAPAPTAEAPQPPAEGETLHQRRPEAPAVQQEPPVVAENATTTPEPAPAPRGPIPLHGNSSKTGEVYLGKGDAGTGNRRIGVSYRVVEAADITATRSRGEVQERDESVNPALAGQVEQIANRLDFRQVAESPDATMGAPILTKAGVALAGNGRALGIQRAYAEGKAEDYRARLVQWAKENGLGDVSDLQQPVLVRIVVDNGGLTDAQIALLSNRATGAAINNAESAMAVANAILRDDSLFGGSAAHYSGMTLAELLRDERFVRRLQTATGYQGEAFTPQGRVTPEFEDNVRRAMVIAALTENSDGKDRADLVRRLSNDQSEGIKAAVDAIAETAPSLLAMRKNAAYRDVSILREVGDALAILASIRADGLTVGMWTGQGSLAVGAGNTVDYRNVEPVTRALVEWFGGPDHGDGKAHPSSKEKNAALLKSYIRHVGNRHDALLPGMGADIATGATAKWDILKQAFRDMDSEAKDGPRAKFGQTIIGHNDGSANQGTLFQKGGRAPDADGLRAPTDAEREVAARVKRLVAPLGVRNVVFGRNPRSRGPSRGSFNTDANDRTIYLEDFSEGTLFHEVAHALWLHATAEAKNHPRMALLLRQMRAIANSAPESLYDIVLKDYAGEKNPDVLLNELFAHYMEVQGGRAWIEAVRERERPWIVRIWNRITAFLESAAGFWLPGMKSKYRDVRTGLRHVAADLAAGREVDIEGLVRAAERGASEDSAIADDAAAMYADGADPVARMPVGKVRRELVKRGMDPVGAPSILRDRLRGKVREEEAARQAEEAARRAEEDRWRREQEERDRAAREEEEKRKKAERDARKAQAEAERQRKEQEAAEASRKEEEARQAAEQARANRTPEQQKEAREAEIARTQEAFDAYKQRRLADKEDDDDTTALLNASKNLFDYLSGLEKARDGKLAAAEREEAKPPPKPKTVERDGQTIDLQEVNRLKREKKIRDLRRQALDLTRHIDDVRGEFGNPDFPTGDLDQAPEPAPAAEQPVAAAPAPQPVKEQPETPEAVSENAEPPQKTENPSPAPEAAKPGDEFASRILDAIETDARDGLIAVFSDNRFGDGAYVANYAAGSMEEVQRAADGIRKAFPGMEVLASDTGLVIKPKKASTQALSQASQESQESKKSQPKAEQPKEATSDNEKTDMELARSVWRDEALSSWKGEKTDKLREYARKAGIPTGGKKRAQLLEELADKFAEGYLMDADGKPLSDFVALMASTHAIEEQEGPRAYKDEFEAIERELTPEEREEYMRLMRDTIRKPDAQNALEAFEERVGIDGSWDEGYWIKRPSSDGKGGGETKSGTPAQESKAPAAEEKQEDAQAIEEGKRLNAEYERTLQARDSQHTEPRSMVDLEWRLAALRALLHEMRHPGTIRPIYARAFGDEYKTPEEVEVAIGHVQRMIEEEAAAQEDLSAKSFTEVKAIAKELGIKTGGKNKTRLVWEIQNKQKAAPPATPALPTMEESGIVQAKETGAEEHEPDASKGQVDAGRGHPVGTGESDDGTGGREVPGNEPRPGGGRAASDERRNNARNDDEVAGEGVAENGGSPQGANGDRRSRNAENHVITDPDFLDAGGAKAKFRDNLAALRVLKTLREEGREATPEERETIAKYVGWGRSEFRNGLFAYWGPEWEKERNQLREVLGDEEFESARRSTLTAFWTPPRMAQGVWKALERLGFQGGRIHEPSIGTGIFYGTMPTDIRDRSQLSGADKDVLASEIARHLYPGARITNGAFQEENLPDDFYDLVVGNFPFADITIRRDKYNHVSANLHDYFWLKSLGIVRPGGLVAAITSTGTMDKANDAVRREIAAKADVVAAVRLPEGTFKGVAGTDVVTDLIILRKRGEGEEMSEDTKAWMDTVRYGELDEKWDVLTGFVNKYYQLHPDHLLGTPTASYGQYGRDTTLKPAKDGNVQERLDSILGTIPENLYAPRARKSGAPKAASTLDATGAASKLRDGSLVAQNGEIWEKYGPALNQVKATPPQKRKARMLIGIRDALNLLRQAETEDNPDMERLRKELNRQYDAFVKEYGPLNKKGMLGIMANDPASHVLLALERSYNPDANKAVKADIFTTRVGYAKSRATTAENYEQAAGFSMNETGRLDAERVGEMMGVDTATAERELLKQGLAYRAPDGELVGADEYLSGNVRDKLRQAEAAARLDPEYNPNVEALRKVLPADKKPGDFTASLGSTWIPGDVMSDFSAHVLGLPEGEKGLSFEYSHSLGRWVVSMPPKGYEAQRIETSSAYTTKYATAHRGFLDILDAAMHDQHMRITRRDPYTGETEFLAVETEEANNKAEQLKDAFLAWVWNDDKRAARLARIYNDTFNGFVERKKGGRWLTFAGMAPSIKPRPHQVAAVEKMLASHRLLMAHEVGTGKTITYGLMAEKAKETGIAAKPLLVVKNSTVKQVAAEIQRLFPNMNIFVGGESMTAGRRKRSMAQIANNNWDIVILTHDNLGTLDADPAIERGFIDGQIEELRAAAYAVMSANMSKKDRERIRRNLLKRIESLEERLKALLKAPKTDGVATFQDLGFDMVMVDECQAFKKLPIATYRSRVKGIPVEGSKRASALLMNVQHLVETNPNACVVFGSGTPLDNSLVEAYVWQRFLQNDLLKAAGIDSFDAWASNFGHTTTDLEMSPSGGDWKEVERFKEFVNLGELSSMMRQNMDVVFADDTGEITRPNRHDQVDNTPPSEVSEEIIADLEARAKAIKERRGKPKKGDDNMLVVCGDGRKAAVHPGLYKPEYVNAKGTKADACIARVAANHKADPKATQMIFCDCGVNDTEWGFNLYKYLRDGLVKAGFKPNQVAFFSSSLSASGRAALADKMNEGEILVAIGSTDTMGTGINAQKRLRWMHHLDASRMMTPGSIEQRNGRGHRQGNAYKDVEVVTYTQEHSLDVFTWNLIKNKAGFINAFLRGENLSTIEEESDTISPDQIVAIASGDPRVFRRAKAEKSLRRLKLQEAAFEQSKKGQMREKSWAERRLAALDAEAKALDTAVEMADRTAGQPFSAQIPKTGLLAASTHAERNSALSSALGAAVESVATDLKGKIDDSGRFERGTVAKYRGFDIQVQWERATSGDKQLRYLLAIPGESGIAYYLSPNFDLNDKKNQMLAVFRSADGVIGQLKHRRQNTIEERATTARRIEELSADLDRQFDGAEKITSLEIELRQLNDALSGKDKEKKKREGEVADAPAPAQEAGGTTLHSRTGVGTPSRDWTTAKIPEMRRELVRRGLSPSGSAAALRRRLEEADKKIAPVNGAPGDTSFDDSSEGVPSVIQGSPKSTSLPIRKDAHTIHNATLSVKQKIRRYKNGDETIAISSSANKVLGAMRKFFGMRFRGKSSYITLETSEANDAVTVETPNGYATFRISNHTAVGDNFRRDGTLNNVSVFISDVAFPREEGEIPYVEFQYKETDFRRRPKSVVDAIVNGVDSLIRTGEYVDESGLAKRVPHPGKQAERGGITLHSRSGLYTGSATDYANRRTDGTIENGPSLQHIGTGEGSQVYGWGLYASTRRGIAESYARKASRNLPLTGLFIDGKRQKSVSQFSSDYELDTIGKAVYFYFRRFYPHEAIFELRDRANLHEEIARKTATISGSDEKIAKERNVAKLFREAADAIETGRAEWRDIYSGEYVYEQTFFTNRTTPEETERHLLKWYEPVSEEQKKWILDEFAKEGKVGFYADGTMFRHGLIMDQDKIIPGETHGEEVYKMLVTECGSPKAASEFLARAGIDGIKYPVDSYGGKTIKDGDKAGWNYVSFRDDNITVDHKWRDGEVLYSRSGVSSSEVDRWFDAQVVERRRGSRRFYDIKSGDDLIGQGYRSREAALFVIERERSLLDLAKEALAKSGLGRDRLANISEARRRFVERMKDSAASNETRAEAFEEFAKSIGLHKDVLEAEWKHAKAILTADSPAQADMRAAIANRAATTVLARASIRAVARDMDKFFKEKLDKDLPAGGLRRNVLTNVADARAAMDRKTSPEDIRRQVADLESRKNALQDMLDTNEDSSGNELTKEEREKVSREYAEKVMQLRILRAFEGLKHNHPGKTAASLLQDLDAWNNAKMELEAITRKSIEDIDRIEAERSEQATMDRAIILDEMTGGIPVPTRNEQRTLNAQHPLRRKAADTARGWFAAILGGGRAWGEFMTGKKSVGYGQSHASKLLHEGLASAQNREMRMKEEDDEHFVEIINRFAKRPLDPKRSLKDMNDYSEYCSGLYLERKENDIRFRKVSYGTEKNPDTGKEERVAIITPGEHCHLSKGELMHIWLIGLQAQDAAGQEYTDLPKKKKGCDTSLMESMLAIGYSARTMDEIRAVLVRENLDQMALAISEDMERKSDPLDDLMERIFHSRLKRIKHYCPLRRTHYGLLEKGDKGANGTGQFMSLVRSFLKERVANHRDIEPMNLIDAWQSHNRQANHIISHADWISRIARIFRNQQIQGAIDWTAGSEAREMFNSWLDIQARGGSVPVSNGLIERLGRTFSRVMTTSLRVAAKQTTSATMALSVLPKGASLTRWWADLAAVTFNPALQTKFRRMLVDESPEWRQRGFYADDMQAMAARGAASRTAPGRLWNIYKTKVGRVLGKMTSFGDKTGAVMGCYGIYKAWERKLKKEGGHSPEETHRLALEKFVEAMNTTQQSAVAEYMSHVQTQGGLMRMMYMFHTAQASMTRNYMLHLRALMQGRGSRGEHIRALAGITFAQFLFLEAAHFFVPMASAMFGAPPDPDDEDEKAAWTVAKDIITAVGTAPMGGLYITGDLIAKGLEATLDWQGKKHGLQKRGPQPLNLANELLPALDPLNDVLPLLKNAPKQIAEFDTLSPDVKERYYRQAADAYGAASGSALPKFLVEFGLGMKDAWTADDLTLLQRAARGLSFSRSAIGAPKRPAPPKAP